MTVGVIGAGAFGIAMALTLAKVSPVLLWGRNKDDIDAMADTRQTGPRLPGFDLPAQMDVTHDLNALRDATIFLICIPTQQLAPFLAENASYMEHAHLVACCKGIDLKSLKGSSSIIRTHLPGTDPAVLTGPSFASDIAKNLPTALTLACARDELAHDLQHSLSTDTLRLYRTTDVIGAELGGALKNVIAIACGAAMGAGLGQSAQASLMTRGFSEMQSLARHLNARPETLMGLSGFGDLVLTCTSSQSRNFRYGHAIGSGTDFEENATVEGRVTSEALMSYDLDLPVCSAVAALVRGETDVQAAMQALLARPLKEE